MATKKKASTAKTASKPETSARIANLSSQDFLYVRDTLATRGMRAHELVDSAGKKKVFTFLDSTTPVEVPTDMAIELIKIEGFAVSKTPDGEPLRPAGRETNGLALASDEIVAKFHELTHDALLHRCNSLDANFNKNTSKNTMIAFLAGGDIEESEDDPYEVDTTKASASVNETTDQLIARLAREQAAGAAA